MSKQMIGSFAIISIAYIASYTLVVGFLSPLQHLIFPTFTTPISLLFLPHGIRILAAYYYGWKSFFLLLPSMYFMWVITVYGSGVPLHPIQPLISGVSCVLGIMIVSKKLTLNFRADLKFILRFFCNNKHSLYCKLHISGRLFITTTTLNISNFYNTN